MLELRPCCEHCAKALPPAATDAMICSFECTYCRDCATGLLHNVCPNCGGGFEARPIRPSQDRKGGNHLGAYPASTTAKHRPADLQAHAALVNRLNGIAPSQR
jgi:hypothetical protein